MYEEADESLRQAIALANLCHTKKLLYKIDAKKPLSYQRFFIVNWMFVVVLKRSLSYEFSLLSYYTFTSSAKLPAK
jgi:hypothetical protein